MIGYKVTATGNGAYSAAYSGWSEGSHKYASMASEAVVKQVIKQVVNRAAGGPVGTVAGILAMPGEAIGKGIMAVIEQNVKVTLQELAADGLKIFDIDVTLTGDFKGAYRVADSRDLKQLPVLLAHIPQKNTTDKFMGESVLRHAVWAHINFARHLRNDEKWSLENLNEVRKLRLNINL